MSFILEIELSFVEGPQLVLIMSFLCKIDPIPTGDVIASISHHFSTYVYNKVMLAVNTWTDKMTKYC